MEYIHFSKLTEDDFDDIILNAGGKRYTDDPKIKVKNCDYILDDTVIELKIIEEEPIEKKSKQEKLAKLFSQISDAKTIVLNPTEDLEHEYYKILVSPIQSQLKKASKQLNYSAKEVNANTKIAIIMNNGLTMTSHEEFKKLAIDRAKNDTSGIDILIVCGIYYFSDKFDMNVMTYFDDIKIQENSNDSTVEKIRDTWHIKVEEYMTTQITDLNVKREKEPIQDLFFEYEGVRYVKPPIQWGNTSEFYGEKGRPREDTDNEKDFLPSVTVIPIFSNESYEYFKTNIIQKNMVPNTLEEYLEPIKIEDSLLKEKIQTLVPISISVKDVAIHNSAQTTSYIDSDLVDGAGDFITLDVITGPSLMVLNGLNHSTMFPDTTDMITTASQSTGAVWEKPTYKRPLTIDLEQIIIPADGTQPEDVINAIVIGLPTLEIKKSAATKIYVMGGKEMGRIAKLETTTTILGGKLVIWGHGDYTP